LKENYSTKKNKSFRKVVVYSDFIYPEYLGGSARFASELNDELNHFTQLKIYTRKPSGVYSGIKNNSRSYMVVYGFLNILLDSFKNIFIRKDLSISHHYLFGFFSLFLSNAEKNIYFFHGPIYGEEIAKSNKKLFGEIKKRIEFFVLKRSSQIYCLSSFMKKNIPKKFHHKTKIIGPVNALVDSLDLKKIFVRKYDEIKYRKNINILCVRRLTPRTGVVELVNLISKISNLSLTIVGKGELYAQLKTMKAPNITILSSLNDEELEKLYLESDLTIVPSIELEGFGLVIIESILRGTAVLVSENAGGGKDFLQKYSDSFIYDLTIDSSYFRHKAMKAIYEFSGTNCHSKIFEDLKNFSMKRFSQNLLKNLT